MPLSTRAEAIDTIRSSMGDHWTSGAQVIPYDVPRLCQLTPEPVYAIPSDLLDLINRRIKGWFSPEELELEHRLTRLCDTFQAVAVFLGRFVRHQFFSHFPPIAVGDDMLRALGWESITNTAALKQVQNRAADLAGSVWDRREAYLGWLITHLPYLAERDALRSRWQEAVNRTGEFPVIRVGQTVEVPKDISIESNPEMESMAEDFAAFYRRWDLLRLTTWDLPEPTGGNFGGPAIVGQLGGVENSPAVQCPRTLRLRVRFPVHDLLKTEVNDHLAEWQAVEDQRYPDRLNYVRLRRVLHLHVIRNVILGGAYRDRFRRRVGLLDSVFADYLGDGDEETVRKLRQWIDCRLRPGPTGRTRNR